MRWKKVPALLLACLLLLCTGCFDSDLDDYEDIYYIPDSSLVVDENPPLPGEVIAYKYPADQAQALRDALHKMAEAWELEFTVGEVSIWSDNDGERREIPIYWRGEQAHSTLISFYTPGPGVISASTHTGRHDVSFNIAFQDPEAMEDMITLAIPVLMYVNPDLNWDTALAVAQNLLDTLTVDGYSDPMDIGGYQFQLHYRNPYIYFRSGDFIANMGLSADALDSIWGDFDTTGYPDMTPALYSAAGRDGSPANVRVTGTITEWYKKLDYYGTPETFVTVSYGGGDTCLLRMNYPTRPYEFALGGRYEFFVMLNHPRGPALIYAIQLDGPG